MDRIDQMAVIFGGILTLSNKLRTLGDRMDDYMSMKQWMLIAAISKSGGESLNIGELAEIVGTSYQNVKKMAVILERQGFLALQKSATDARVVLISLTPQCAAYFSKREDMERKFLLSLFDGMDETAISDLYNGILRLNETVSAKARGAAAKEG